MRGCEGAEGLGRRGAGDWAADEGCLAAVRCGRQVPVNQVALVEVFLVSVTLVGCPAVVGCGKQVAASQ